MDVLYGVRVAREAALGLLEQAVVPLNPVARLPLLHQHQTGLLHQHHVDKPTMPSSLVVQADIWATDS